MLKEMVSRDTTERAASAQLEVYRRMQATERLRVGLELTRMSRRLLADGIRARHPDYSDEQVRLAMIRLWLGDDDFRRAYPTEALLEP
jgi:hypothetical protein